MGVDRRRDGWCRGWDVPRQPRAEACARSVISARVGADFLGERSVPIVRARALQSFRVNCTPARTGGRCVQHRQSRTGFGRSRFRRQRCGLSGSGNSAAPGRQSQMRSCSRPERGRPSHRTTVLRRDDRPGVQGVGSPTRDVVDLRRTYSLWSHEREVPGKVIAQLMGHAHVDTTLNVHAGDRRRATNGRPLSTTHCSRLLTDRPTLVPPLRRFSGRVGALQDSSRLASSRRREAAWLRTAGRGHFRECPS
jgi:hypothetical protein